MAVTGPQAIRSYYRVRQAMGLQGLALPVLLIGGSLYMGDPLPPALSDYVYTPLEPLFTGVMFSIAIFLISYLGYDREGGPSWITDRRVSTLAGLGAMGIALFPNDTFDPCGELTVRMFSATGVAHVVSAAIFLVMTCVFCLLLFRRRIVGDHRAQKSRRNAVYLACGLVILGALLGLAYYFLGMDLADRCAIAPLKPVLWLEVATVWAFGLAWLVKGGGIRKLNDGYSPRGFVSL